MGEGELYNKVLTIIKQIHSNNGYGYKTIVLFDEIHNKEKINNKKIITNKEPFIPLHYIDKTLEKGEIF